MGKPFLMIASALAAGLIAYFVYLDHKRTSDPNYRLNVVKRRIAALANASMKPYNKVYQLRRNNSYERAFLRELRLAEELAIVGDYTNAVHHFLNASDICVDPVQLFMKMRQTLPADIFAFIVAKIHDADSESESDEVEELQETLERSYNFSYFQ